jgi:hypothetical protein
MEKSGFFDAVYNEFDETYDKEYAAEQFASYFALFIKNGVFGSPTNQLKVSASSGMNIKISPGWAFINGYWYYNDEDLILPVSQNLSSTVRKDSVICRWNNSDRKITSAVNTGSTEITRTESYYDLKLAEISVASGAVSITDSSITDTRTDENVCGLVTGLLKTETTADLFAQFTAAFNEWFEDVKDQVTGDLAIKLQQEFTELSKRVEDYQKSTEKSISEFETTVNNKISDIEEVANTAKNTIQDFVDKDFVIAKQSLVFSNSICTITDSRVTAGSLVDVYFTKESTPAAEAATIYVDSEDGKIVLTATTQPTGALEAIMRVRVR